MTTIPPNLTLIRENFQKPGSLAALKAAMLAAPTDYVMVVGKDDIVDISGVLEGEVHYLATHVATRRAYRHARPVLVYDPVLLTQMNYAGMPILHQSVVPLFPETAVEPWHTVMVRAQSQGASFSLVGGSHTIVEPWPRPIRGGAYSQYRYSFDPAAIMEAVPAILVQEINQRPFYSLRDPRVEAVTAFCHNCSDDFISSLAAPNVHIRVMAVPDYSWVQAASTNYVTWFSNIAEAVTDKFMNQLQLALEFPGVSIVSPHVLGTLSPATYSQSAFSTAGAIINGFHSGAWMARTRDLNVNPPSSGYTNTQAILREIL